MGLKDHFTSTGSWVDLLPGENEFRRRGFTFGFCEPPSDEGEYYVTRVAEQEMEPWYMSDNPDLVFELIDIERGPDGFSVEHDKMASFLEEYGPLTRSYAPAGADLSSPAVRGFNNVNDPRNEHTMYLFSRVVDELTYVTETASQLGPKTAFAACLYTLDESPRDSLFRALVLQLLLSYQDPPYPRRCIGCTRWFSVTEDESQARHQEGWKRNDAKYHSKRCRKAKNERDRRARLREEKKLHDVKKAAGRRS